MPTSSRHSTSLNSRTVDANSRTQHHRAILVSIRRPERSAHETKTSASELTRLAHDLGIHVQHSVQQLRPNTAAVQILGEGKLEELRSLLQGTADGEVPPTLLLVDAALTPGQQRYLEEGLEIDVWDRTKVILEVFERRAGTREARLQVKIARLQYELPRLRETRGDDHREGGGGRGERGHTGVELAKQRSRQALADLQRELGAEQARASTARGARQHLGRVALVGYTNAGKSSWMRALTGSDVEVEDKLFATLGTTVRTLTPASNPRILVSDTVGFIDHLPHELIASFRTTLAEAAEASLLLIIVDCADPAWRRQLEVTRATLEQVGAGQVESRLLLNKVDRLRPEELDELRAEQPTAILASAHDSGHVARVRNMLLEHFDRSRVEGELFVPFDHGRVLGEVFATGSVLGQEHVSDGTLLRVRADSRDLQRWKAQLATRAER